MIAGWDASVYWAKNRSWQENEITRKLVELVGSDFAIKIWDQHQNRALDWLYGSKDREAYTLKGRIKFLFKSSNFPLGFRFKFLINPGVYISPIEKLKTEEGRTQVMQELCNPWTN